MEAELRAMTCAVAFAERAVEMERVGSGRGRSRARLSSALLRGRGCGMFGDSGERHGSGDAVATWVFAASEAERSLG